METSSAATTYPDWLARISFFLRSKGLQVRRLAQDTLHPSSLLTVGAIEDFPYVLAESVSKLQSEADPRERLLVLGKIHNLRLACRRIHQRRLVPDQTFSFWQQIGPPWRLRGFARGREVREGCVIPTFGGGLCQLSGSLLEIAMALGLDVVERHSHTALPVDVPRNPRRDATLFWNYVDLRFRSRIPILFECFLTDDALVVRARGQRPQSASVQIRVPDPRAAAFLPHIQVQSCLTCSQSDCSRHVSESLREAKTAFLVDEYQPEFARLVRDHIKQGDQLLFAFTPQASWDNSVNGAKLRVKSPPCFRIRRSLMLRWAVYRGITVAKTHFELAGMLARFYERRIGHDIEHLCVAQALLPHLWQSGVLGGRSFDVLMQRLPVYSLEQQLNAAAQLYPQSKTLAEFRAPRWFAETEHEALAAARTVYTPHSHIAALFKNRAVCLAWETQARQSNGHGLLRDLIVFIGPTLARKGAYAVRELVQKTGHPLSVLGPELEEPGFWRGLPVARLNPSKVPWERIHTVVQPALFEYWPRQLLKAHGAGANLITTPLCGLEESHDAGIYHVPFGDVGVLAATLNRLLTNRGYRS
jgi:hypothetical protein